jgi:TrmH family RNA methyltransferase
VPNAPELVTSTANPLVRRMRALVARAGEDTCLVEGPRLLLEAIAANATILEVAVTLEAEADPRNISVFAALGARGLAWRRFEPRLLASLSSLEHAQGILAILEKPHLRLDAAFAGTPLVLIAVGVQDPGNVGGLVRSAEAAGASGVLLTRGSADPFSWKALRGSMGSAFRLPLATGLTTQEAMALCHRHGLRTASAVAREGMAPREADLTGPLALLLGSEAAGLPDEIVAASDLRLTIPLCSPVESLNVGVAAGILLFEAARQRSDKSGNVKKPAGQTGRDEMTS